MINIFTSVLENLEDQQLLQTMRAASRLEQRSLCEFLIGLSTVEERGLHLQLGYPNLFEFSRCEFGLSEGCIYRRLQVARKIRHFPELLAAIREHKLNLTLASMLCPYLGRYSWQTLLQAVEGQTKRKAQKALVDLCREQVLPSNIPMRIQYLGKDIYSYKLRIPAALHHELERVRELMSHQIPEGDWTDILQSLVSSYLLRCDPQQKISSNDVLWDEYRSPTRYIPKGLKQKILHNADFQCQFQGLDGRRCHQKRYLDIDHVIPMAKGGLTELANLQVLCRAHNLLKGTELPSQTNHNQPSSPVEEICARPLSRPSLRDRISMLERKKTS